MSSETAILVPASFDYSILPVEVAEEARAVAARVRSRHQQQITAIIETGHDLTRMKANLGHGNFETWISAEFGMTIRTAQNYMSASSAFGGKSEIISYLPPSAVYALAAPSTPDPVREMVIERLEAGERIDPLEVRDLVKEAKAAEREVKQAARFNPAQRRYRRNKEAEQRKQDEEWRERREKELAAAKLAADFVAERLGSDFEEFQLLLMDCSAVMFAEAIKNRQ